MVGAAPVGEITVLCHLVGPHYRHVDHSLADEGKEHREINGQTYVLEYPLPADYAFIRAWRADTFGNLQFRLAQRNFNPIMGMAATITVVEVEDAILEPGELDADQIHLPGVYVDRLVKIPPDSIPD